MERKSKVPWPERPGTICEWDKTVLPRLICINCGKDWNSHGGSEEDAKKYGIRFNDAHKMCKWSDEAWEKYLAACRRENLDNFVTYWVQELRKLEPAQRAIAIVRIQQQLTEIQNEDAV